MKATSISAIHASPKPTAEPRVDSHLVLVYPEAARRWLDKSMWGKQRQYRPWHAEELAQAMRNGEFVEGTQIHFAKFKGEVHCVNGQHTLHAVVKANMPINLTVVTTLVKDEGEIADLYSRMDTHLRRTLADSYQAHDLAGEMGMAKAQINAMGAAVRHMLTDFAGTDSGGNSYSYKTRSADERVRQIGAYKDAAKGFFAATQGAILPVRRALAASSVLAVALMTFERDASKAREFWSQVAFSESLENSDPRKTLINWLLANADLKKARHQQRAHVAATAWNVFVAGGKLSRIKTPDWTKPVVING